MAGKADMEKLKSWMRRRFMADRCGQWDSTIHIRLRGAGNITAEFEDGKMRLLNGLKNEPLAEVRTSVSTLKDILRNAIPLEIAAMKNEIETNNMVEVFKFVTVFRPDARRIVSPAGKVGAKKNSGERAPLMQGGDRAREFLDLLNEKIARDEFINSYLKEHGKKSSFMLALRNPEMSVSLDIGKKGMNLKWLEPGASADAAMETSTLHGILSGAQNIMIDLTDKNLDEAAPGIGAQTIETLLHIQPALAMLYRELIREGRRV